jgi:hypothetical protein
MFGEQMGVNVKICYVTLAKLSSPSRQASCCSSFN